MTSPLRSMSVLNFEARVQLLPGLRVTRKMKFHAARLLRNKARDSPSRSKEIGPVSQAAQSKALFL